MADAFLTKLIIAFFAGSVWITISTVISEKFGTKLGGVLAGLPSTVVISLFFIGWTQSPLVASESTAIIPFVVGIYTLFIVTYVFVSRFNFYLAILASLAVWFLLSFSLVLLKFSNFAYSLIGFLALLLFSYYALEKKLHITSEGRKAIKYTAQKIAIRAVLSGTVIAFAVTMAKIGGPLLGGMFAAFPAVMLSTAVITYLAHGKSFSHAVMKVLMVSGSVNVVAFAIAVRYTYPRLGLAYGTLSSFAASLIVAYLVYTFINKKMS